MFGWLKEKRRLKFNPMIALTSPSAPKARDHVLTNPEIVKLWAVCDAQGFPFGPLLKLLALTGCRREEVAGMRRTELSEDLRDMDHPGPADQEPPRSRGTLPPMARNIIRSIDQHGDLVFTTNGRTRSQVLQDEKEARRETEIRRRGSSTT